YRKRLRFNKNNIDYVVYVAYRNHQIRVAQRKRGGPITHRSQDRNLALIKEKAFHFFFLFFSWLLLVKTQLYQILSPAKLMWFLRYHTCQFLLLFFIQMLTTLQ
ncbi:hypothetical protein PHAVU_005G168400, partial [Phaseolus vulgaris]